MADSNLYWKENDDGLMILVIFVDDIIFGGNGEENKNFVEEMKKELYSLKQTPRTWYARLDKYLTKIGYRKGMENSNLYWKEIDDGLMILVIFFDDIIFRGDDDESDKFAEEMKNEFEISIIREMKYLLGL